MFFHVNGDFYSILFADIVGFTSLSSNPPANEMLAFLNELFADFDLQAQVRLLDDFTLC